MTLNATNEKEGDFTLLLLLSLMGKGGSMRSLLEHSKFRARLTCFTHRHDFRVFRGERDAEDLAQDILVKLLVMDWSEKLRIPDNVTTEEQFFSWLFVVVHNEHLDSIRRHTAAKRDGLRSLKCLDDFDLAAPRLDYDREEILARFPEFMKQYPLERQIAVRLWLKGKPYRRISRILKRMGGPNVTHATIGNWINAILRKFRGSIEPLPHTNAIRRPVKIDDDHTTTTQNSRNRRRG